MGWVVAVWVVVLFVVFFVLVLKMEREARDEEVER